jgi:IBR domain, a half RING-finger domain
MRAGSRALTPNNITSGGGLWHNVVLDDLVALMQHCLPWARADDLDAAVRQRSKTLPTASLWDTARHLIDAFPWPTDASENPDPARSFGLVDEAVTAALVSRVRAYARKEELQSQLDLVKELPEGADGETCCLCMELHSLENTVSCERLVGDAHVLCRPCFSSYLTITHLEHASNTDLAAVSCCCRQANSCEGMYDLAQVRANVSTLTRFVTEEKHHARMSREALETVLKEGNAIELTCACGYVGVLEKNRVIQCPACEKKMCTLCRGEYHGETICPPSKQMSKVLKDPDTSRCPGCGQGIQRISGCNHLKCPCGTHFCIVCGKKYGRQYFHAACELVQQYPQHRPRDMGRVAHANYREAMQYNNMAMRIGHGGQRAHVANLGGRALVHHVPRAGLQSRPLRYPFP